MAEDPFDEIVLPEDPFKALEKIDCEKCNLEDVCDHGNLCAEWITQYKDHLLGLKEKAEKWDRYLAVLSDPELQGEQEIMDILVKCAENNKLRNEYHTRLEDVKKLLPLVEELYGLCRHVNLGNHQCAGCQMYGLPKKLRTAVEGS